ncbi:MAG: RNA 2',3'-cyclic phosphodiesterase [Thermoprotei archaeon]|nr:MAG: RNA 2',3'-cyclic phosphodiesterase [Thermoprotei archaeon]RLF24843.1 MAG: RNA 2',3'-cyclic phosphodiesterase [Thermoprotei archaeon]
MCRVMSLERIRSFISIDVEDPELIERIVDVQRRIAATGAGLKLVRPENIHLTIRFLGEIPRKTIDMVIEIMKGVKFRPFKMRICNLGTFPERRRPRVIWLGVGEGAREVTEIYESLEKELRRIGLPSDKEAFVPHITIARVKWSSPSLMGVINELRGVDIGEMMVDRIRLKKSTLTPRGPIYETLFEVKAEVN